MHLLRPLHSQLHTLLPFSTLAEVGVVLYEHSLDLKPILDLVKFQSLVNGGGSCDTLMVANRIMTTTSFFCFYKGI